MKEKRLHAVTSRMTDREKKLIERAADDAGESVSRFVQQAAVRAAKSELLLAGILEDVEKEEAVD